MAGKSDALETAVLDAVLRNDTTALTGLIGATRYCALYTADPGESGTATTNEIAYTSYARVAITSTSGWTSSGNPRSNTGTVTWPTCTGGSGTATHWAIVTTSSGAGSILYFGALTSSLAISTSSNATPQAAIGALTVAED